MLYEVVTWPDVQELMTIDGFRENSYLVNDEKGIEDFGSSAYFVSVDWLEELYNTVTMTEERYQYLNSLSMEDYEKNTTVSEQLAFINYQIKHHPDEVMYFQTHDGND